MKTGIFFFACFFTANIASAQAFTDLSIGTEKTFKLEAGYLDTKLNAQVSIGGIISYNNTSRPNITYLNMGYRVKLGDELKFTATPSIGIARVTFMNPYKVIKNAGHGPAEVININSYKFMYSLELGKEVGIGRFYVSYTKAGSYVFYMAGIKAFIRDFEQIGFDPSDW